MPHVLIASNRLPVTVKKVNGRLRFETSMGGVATGLSSLIKARQNRWIGWPGIASDDLSAKERQKIISELDKRNCVPVFLTAKQVEDFYNGYSNSLLWPLLHNLPMDDGKDHARWWKTYREVNQMFADTVCSYAKPATTVWVHDYQLMLVPEMLRASLPNNHIGFFLHTPICDARSLKKFPESKKLIAGVLGADLAGFHTRGYVENFTGAVEAYDFGKAHGDQLVLGERTIRITEFPIGIDYNKFTGAHRLPAVKAAAKEYSRKYKGKKIIAGVDRLDITKGFVERLTAYHTFLERNPKQRGKVVFVLVGAPSRGEVAAYQRLAKRVKKLVTEINGTYGNSRWQPVDYIDQAIPFEQVTALFQVANVAFIAPVRDGMNLVAKEYIASRRKNGILILSQTAGAAEELQDALLVDLKKPETLVAALETALRMRKREIRRRFALMQDRVADQTIHKWSKDFMGTLQKPIRLPTLPLTIKARRAIGAIYANAARRALFIDYDGTINEIMATTAQAAPKKETIRLLENLAADSRNDIFLVTGRPPHELDSWFKKPPFTIIAEHGAFMLPKGKVRWQSTLKTEQTNWQSEVLPILTRYADDTKGARVEVKTTALVWHYRGASPYYSQKNMVLIKKELRDILKSHDLKAYSGKKILEIKHKDVNKGAAVKEVLKAKDYDFVLVAGDDYTDEHMFKTVPEWAYSLKVGGGSSAARYRIKDPSTLRHWLRELIA